MTNLKQLAVDEYGRLCLDGQVLICLYPQGDCDTIQWPDFNAQNLRSALYDEFETGRIPLPTRSVLLPDGSQFNIDGG